MTEPTTPAPTGAATPGAPAQKKPRVRRPGTSIERAMEIARRGVVSPEALTRMLGEHAPVECADQQLASVEEDCERRLLIARGVRDFAREIEGLGATERAMLRAGIAALASPPSRGD